MRKLIEGGDGRGNYRALGGEVAGMLRRFRTNPDGGNYPQGDGLAPRPDEVSRALIHRRSLLEGLENETDFKEAVESVGGKKEKEPITAGVNGGEALSLSEELVKQMHLDGGVLLLVEDLRQQLGPTLHDPSVASFMTYKNGNRAILANMGADNILRVELVTVADSETKAQVNIKFDQGRIAELRGEISEDVKWPEVWRLLYRAVNDPADTGSNGEPALIEDEWGDQAGSQLSGIFKGWGVGPNSVSCLVQLKEKLEAAGSYNCVSQRIGFTTSGDGTEIKAFWVKQLSRFGIRIENIDFGESMCILLDFNGEGQVINAQLIDEHQMKKPETSNNEKIILGTGLVLLSDYLADNWEGDIKLEPSDANGQELGNDGVINNLDGLELPRWYDNKN